MRVVILSAGLLLAACAHRPAPISLPDYDPGPEASASAMRPQSMNFEPELVPYPGLGVSFVANVEEETYEYEKRFYCFLGGRWYKADAMSGPWGALSMKYVPVAIYRVRGHLPPALEKKARVEQKASTVSLVSFQLLPSE